MHTIVRGGRLLDIRRHAAEPADILVEGDRIHSIGPPGMAAPEGAMHRDAAGRLLMPGLVNAHTHGHNNLAKSLGDRWNLELLLNAAPWIAGGRTLEDKYLSTAHRRGGNGAQGLHRRLRSHLRVPRPRRRKGWRPSAAPMAMSGCGPWSLR